MIHLMDMGTHFDMIYGKEHIAIHFGEYALSLANTNYDKMQKLIEQYLDLFTTQFETATTLGHIEQKHPDMVKKYASYGIYPNTVNFEVIQILNSKLYKPLYKFLNNGYLNKKQLTVITQLILSELELNISSNTFNWQEESTYIPSVLNHKELREHLDDILLRNSKYFSTEIQNQLSQKIIASSINIDNKGQTRITYHIDDTISFLLVDLQKYITGSKTVMRCENPDCKRLFYPLSGKNKHYCRLKHNNTKLTCNEIMHRKPKDEFAEKSKTARGKQQQFINNALALKNNPKYKYDYALLDKLYQLWQEECSKQMIAFRNKNDIEGYKNWIFQTRFTVKRLEEAGVRTVINSSSKAK